MLGHSVGRCEARWREGVARKHRGCWVLRWMAFGSVVLPKELDSQDVAGCRAWNGGRRRGFDSIVVL